MNDSNKGSNGPGPAGSRSGKLHNVSNLRAGGRKSRSLILFFRKKKDFERNGTSNAGDIGLELNHLYRQGAQAETAAPDTASVSSANLKLAGCAA